MLRETPISHPGPRASSLPLRAAFALILLAGWPAVWRPSTAQTAPLPAAQPTRRAVLVGVNKYSPCKPGEAATANQTQIPGVAPGRSHCNDWVNLDGSLNDVQAMRQVLQARFGFEKENMHVLSTPLIPGVSEKEATRQNILDAVNKYLIEEAKPGDIVVFYYAGHGSQMGNSKSREAASAGGTGMDETIVPADANRGVWDIRDKEFARMFNKIVDRQATLTAIFDSCHSGSIARGAVVPHKSRHIADDDRDSKDNYDETPPENRGALIFSAALSSQSALEVDEDEESSQKPISHGAFTFALLKVLRTAPVNLPAQDIALMVKAQLDAENIRQLPNLNGTDERKKIFQKQLLTYVPLAAHIRRILQERTNHVAPRSRFFDELEDHMSTEDAEHTLRAITALGRFAELYAYDDDSQTFSLENPA